MIIFVSTHMFMCIFKNLCACVCVRVLGSIGDYLRVYTHVHVYLCVFMNINVCVCMCVYVCVRVCVRVLGSISDYLRLYTRVYVYLLILCVCACVRINQRLYVYLCIFMCVCACVRINQRSSSSPHAKARSCLVAMG